LRRISKEVAVSLADSFAQSTFARLINSPAGRVARVVVGLGLIVWGYTLRSGPGGIVLMVVGLVPLIAGAFDLCVISALLGGPISGSRVGKGANADARKIP
jgi:hypothetical protein